MQKTYLTYIILTFLLNLLIWTTPFLEKMNHPLSSSLYLGFSYICHQLTSRSLCLFEDGIRSCTPQEGVRDLSYSKENVVIRDGKLGYKLPVDSRDTAIYAAMLIGGLVLPFFIDIKSKKIPPLWIFILAMIPIGLDGTTQLLGWRESTNLVRVLTGGIIGLIIPFYLIPVLNFFSWKIKR